MATVTKTGVVRRDLLGYQTLLQERWRAEFGANFALEPETPAGQIIGIMAAALAEADDAVVDALNSLDLYTARGNQLDALATLFGVARSPGTRSTAQGAVTGTAGVVIPRNSRVATRSGEVFRTVAAYTIPDSGVGSVALESVVEGAVVAGAGDISRIISLVAGWRGISNPAPAVPGARRANDSDFRVQYGNQLAARYAGTAESIRGALLSIPGVRRVALDDNSTSAAAAVLTGWSIPAHSILLRIDYAAPATAAAILRQLEQVKPLGVQVTTGTPPGSGAVIEPAADAPIRWARVVRIPTQFRLDITQTSDFPGDGEMRLRDLITAQSETDWEIGLTPDRNRMYATLYRVPGYTVDAIQQRRAAGAAGGETTLPAPQLWQIYTLAINDVAFESWPA